MKLRFKLAGIDVQGIKIDNIEVSTEYSLQEITGEYALVKQIIKELPEVMTDLKTAFVKFTEIDNEMEEARAMAREEEISSRCDLMERHRKEKEERDTAFQRVLREVAENNLREESEV